MSNKNLTIWLTVVTIIAVLGLFLPVRLAVAPTAGSTGSRFPNGVSADSTSPSAGQVRGTTLTVTGASAFAGAIIETSTGTSTLSLLSTSATKGFCINVNATSSATVLNLTATTTTSSNGGSSGLLLQYGACT